jgi:hypothetical protein
MLEEKVDVIAVQKTHTASAERLRRRENLIGFTLVGAVYSSVHGTAPYTRSDLSNWRIVYQDHTNNVHVLWLLNWTQLSSRMSRNLPVQVGRAIL